MDGWRRARLVAVAAPSLKPGTSTGPPTDAVDQLGHVVSESLDRHRPAGVCGVAVALEHRPNITRQWHIQPGENVAKAALEREDAAVDGERAHRGLLEPNGDTVDLLVGMSLRP